MFLRIAPLFTNKIRVFKRYEKYFTEVGKYMAPTIMTYIAYKMILKVGKDITQSNIEFIYYWVYGLILAAVFFTSFATKKGYRPFFYSIAFIVTTFLIST